ncbi:hypothetical protein XA68_11698 [Ophiocordyceps unilateralis]|uniref:FAD/NAD(P)-binding domain-containing protein n=1 Tax=Ophiocordyceps unilateralis TaxID=268505 RepID=A0A2A9PEV6_OPHUN|nr:hypothetical protein XA68_11698 [Ophiocordyceps unilateralis]
MTPSSASTSPLCYEVAIVGNGPRGASLNMNAILVALAEAESFKAIQTRGNSFKVRFHTFEKKPWQKRAVGNAFSPTCHAAVNTPVVGPSDTQIPNLDKVQMQYANIVHRATDLGYYLGKHVESNWTDIMADYERVNTAAAACLRRATRLDGSVDVSLPCVTRGTLGTVLQSQFDTVIRDGSKAVPFLDFNFYYEVEVVSYDVTTNRSKPCLVTRPVRGGRMKKRIFDHIVLAGGTVLENPVSGRLLERTYLGEANFDDIRSFYRRLGLLLPDESLDPKARVLILGMGLSAIDKATVGSRSAGFARSSESDPSGFEMIDGEVDKYAGSFTMMSRSPCRFVAPRQVFHQRWLSPTYQPLSQLAVRAAFMDDSPSTLSRLLCVLYAAVARALGTTPDKNPLFLQTPLDFQLQTFEDNVRHLNSITPETGAQTWSGYLRSGMLSITHGGGVQGSKKHKDDGLLQQMTKGRDGFMVLRSMASHYSKPKVLASGSNADFVTAWERAVYPYVGASPVPVAHYFASMFKTGVSSHLKASFEELEICPETGKVKCGGQLFDCVLGSRVIPIHLKSKPRISRTSQLKESVPNKPALAKGRIYQNRNGELCNATELGIIGHGIIGKDEAGNTILQDANWLDTHSHASAVQTSPNIIKYIFTKAALTANGCQDAATEVQVRYATTLLSDSEYYKAANKLRQAHRELHETVAYCRFCTDLANGDASIFAAAFDRIETAASRDAFVRLHGGVLSDPNSCGARYFAHLRTIPPYKPKSRQEYYDDYIDFTCHEIHEIWTHVCRDLIEMKTEYTQEEKL